MGSWSKSAMVRWKIPCLYWVKWKIPCFYWVKWKIPWGCESLLAAKMVVE
jgi:hypothetical protein